jgi:hypothetical protein
MSQCEQRENVKFCQNLGKSSSETLQFIKQAYGEEALGRSAVFKWHKHGTVFCTIFYIKIWILFFEKRKVWAFNRLGDSIIYCVAEELTGWSNHSIYEL